MHKCVECDREIAPPSPIATYENKYYHPECLRCSKCSRSLSGKQFIKEKTGALKTGALMCEDCNEKYAPKCRKCGLSFGAGQSYKKITDQLFYHNDCFKCVGPCKKPIAAEFYDLENGKFICTDCYDKYGTDFDNSDVGIAAPPPPISEPPQTRGGSSKPARLEVVVRNLLLVITITTRSWIISCRDSISAWMISRRISRRPVLRVCPRLRGSIRLRMLLLLLRKVVIENEIIFLWPFLPFNEFILLIRFALFRCLI